MSRLSHKWNKLATTNRAFWIHTQISSDTVPLALKLPRLVKQSTRSTTSLPIVNSGADASQLCSKVLLLKDENRNPNMLALSLKVIRRLSILSASSPNRTKSSMCYKSKNLSPCTSFSENLKDARVICIRMSTAKLHRNGESRRSW